MTSVLLDRYGSCHKKKVHFLVGGPESGLLASAKKNSAIFRMTSLRLPEGHSRSAHTSLLLDRYGSCLKEKVHFFIGGPGPGLLASAKKKSAIFRMTSLRLPEGGAR